MISPELLRLSVPMIVAQLAYASMGFIDTLLLGQLGVEFIAGGGLGAAIYQFFYIVGIGLFVSTANHIAFAKGSQNTERIQQALLSGTLTVAILCCVFIALSFFAEPLLIALGQAPQTSAIAAQYLSIVVWSLLPAFLFILLRSLLLGLGDPGAILTVSLIAAFLNYPVSYALMVGAWGLPRLGLLGVAWGTVIISAVMFLGLLWPTYRNASAKAYPFWKKWSYFSWAQFLDTWRLGVPIALAHAMEIGLFAGAALLVGLISIEALAAHQIALQCATIAFMLPLGISQAVSVMVGEQYGKGSHQGITLIVREGITMASLSATIAASIFIMFPEFLYGLFVDQDNAEIRSIVVSVLLIAALFQWVDGWQVILMGALRGLKKGMVPTIASVVSFWCIGFGTSYLLLSPYGAVGVWVGMGVGLLSGTLMYSGLLLSYLKRLDF